MGGVNSRAPCRHPLNPDILSVITLSDSAVQRLPLSIEDTPLDKEMRDQNIDDFWRDRLICMENAHAEAKRITEKEFQRLEFAIKRSKTGSGKYVCPRMLEDSMNCYMVNSDEPLNCANTIQNFELCLDTKLQESSRKRYEEFLRKSRKRKC